MKNEEKSVMIGHLILLEMKRQRRSAAWLADQLQCNRTNIYKIFSRQSVDSDLLLRISRALSHNFFDAYSELLKAGK